MPDRPAESKTIGLIVSGTAAAAESTDLMAEVSTVLLLHAAIAHAAARTIIDFFIVYYFFRKNNRIGTPLKLKFSLNLFSR
jgi:hypothetical protein